MFPRRHLIAATAAVACALHLDQAVACQPCANYETGTGYVLDLADGRHVFVMKNPRKVLSLCISERLELYPTRAEAETACRKSFEPADPRLAICLSDAHEQVPGKEEMEARCRFQISPADPQDRYPFSGVYSSDSPGVPIWKWEGGYLSRNTVGQGISPDGRFLIVYSVPQSTDETALRIFESGRLVKSFALSNFLDSVTQIHHPFDPCGCGPGPAWFKTWDLDYAAGQLSVETHAGRALTIDVATGQIIASERITRMTVEALAILRDGTRTTLSDVGNCGFVAGMMGMDIMRRADGLTDVPAFVGYEVEKTFESSAESVAMFSVPLDDVRTLTPAGRDDEERPLSRVTLVNGGTREVRVDPSFWILCGNNAAGKRITIPFGDLQSLTIIRPSSGA